MTLSRRRMLRAAAGIAAAPILCAIAKAQGYPSHPVRFVVPFPPGGVSDIIARLIGQKLSERLGQPFVIEGPGRRGEQRHRNRREGTCGRTHAALRSFR